MATQQTLPIRVENPRRLPGWQIPADRIPVGIPGDYKPSLTMLSDGELVMVALYNEKLQGGKCREWTPLWRSTDGGRTWSERTIVQDMIGREQWLTATSGNVLFASSHILIPDINNHDGNIHSYLHRSVDRGRSWERTKCSIQEDKRHGVPQTFGTHTSRNVVELPDDTLLFGVGIGMTNIAYLWQSHDAGETWDDSLRVGIQGYYENADSFFSEDYTYRHEDGKLTHFLRVGPPSPMYPMDDGRRVPVGDDSGDRTFVCESDDGGKTWKNIRSFGDYGVHYIRIIKLQDGRLLMTYTQRALYYPYGLRAMLSYDNGRSWDFNSDRIIIEGKTPWGYPWGTGFGNTVQLSDGTLVSCYSYMDWDDVSHAEVVRWRLPAMEGNVFG